jgi:hypothetical protein
LIPKIGGKGTVMQSLNLPLGISLENVGDGFRVSLAEFDHGWERILRSAWYSDLSAARARALEWSVANGRCAIREIGTNRVPG